MLRLPAMQRYEFHANLPPDCQLRVRGGPTSEAETLGVVTRADEIYATAVYGDWIQVELPGVTPNKTRGQNSGRTCRIGVGGGEEEKRRME